MKRLKMILTNLKLENFKKYVGKFNRVGALFKYKEFWLSHAPIHPAELRGRKNVHGHVHNKTIIDPNYFNLSVENCLGSAPVDLRKLSERPQDCLQACFYKDNTKV